MVQARNCAGRYITSNRLLGARHTYIIRIERTVIAHRAMGASTVAK